MHNRLERNLNRIFEKKICSTESGAWSRLFDTINLNFEYLKGKTL